MKCIYWNERQLERCLLTAECFVLSQKELEWVERGDAGKRKVVERKSNLINSYAENFTKEHKR